MYSFTKRFATSNKALIEMANISNVISTLVFAECPPTPENEDDFQFDENELRINAIQSLCAELCVNTPDRTRDAFPEVPSFTVNAYDFFYKTGRNIGFGVSYDRETGEYIGKIIMYIAYKYININPVMKYLMNPENGWTQEEDRRRKHRYTRYYRNDETADSEDTEDKSVDSDIDTIE